MKPVTFSENITLENKRVLLQPLREKHTEDLLPIALENPELLRYSLALFGTKERLEALVTNLLELKAKKQKYPFVIFDKQAQAYCGITTLLNISPEHSRLEIGSTWIGTKYQCTGLNRSCKFLLLRYAFETLKYKRVELKTDERNEQSKKAILGIGCAYEGTLRSHTVMPDGYRRNTVYFGMLKDEWPSVKSSIFKGY